MHFSKTTFLQLIIFLLRPSFLGQNEKTVAFPDVYVKFCINFEKTHVTLYRKFDLCVPSNETAVLFPIPKSPN
jgi:hypothetical protein